MALSVDGGGLDDLGDGVVVAVLRRTSKTYKSDTPDRICLSYGQLLPGATPKIISSSSSGQGQLLTNYVPLDLCERSKDLSLQF